MPSVVPSSDPLDDEEPLARLDQPEPAGLPHERRVPRGIGEPALELPPLVAEVPDFGGALDERMSSVDVRVQRAVVEKPDETERSDSEPASDEDTAARTAAPPLLRWSGHGPSVFAQATRGPAPVSKTAFGVCPKETVV